MLAMRPDTVRKIQKKNFIALAKQSQKNKVKYIFFVLGTLVRIDWKSVKPKSNSLCRNTNKRLSTASNIF